MEKKKEIFDYKTALLKAQKYCAYQERSQQEIRNKASLPDLNFSDGRFQIGDKVMGKSNKKRKGPDEF
jgi:hypothetical protein